MRSQGHGGRKTGKKKDGGSARSRVETVFVLERLTRRATSASPDAMASWCCCAADGGGERGQGVWGRHAPIKVFQKEVPSILSVNLSSPPLRAMRAVPLPPSRGVTAGDTPDPEDSYPRASGQVSFQISKVSTGGDASIQLEGTT